MKADVQMISGELVVSGVSSSSLLLSNMITSNLHLNHCYFTTKFFFFGGGELLPSSGVKLKKQRSNALRFFSWKVLKNCTLLLTKE